MFISNRCRNLQGQKYIDENNKKRGIYDIVTKFSVDAEPNFAITSYTPYISSTGKIIDATYIQSDVNQTYSLGGELGFSGQEIGASVSFSRSYSGSSTSQNIVNDFPFYENYRQWIVTPINEKNYNASYYIEPGIRVLSNDDDTKISATLTYSDMKARDNRWWIFSRRGTLADTYRRKMTITWSSNDDIYAKDYI